MSFDDLVEVRGIDILGETDWFWIKTDSGGFGDAKDGPMRDWIDGHSKKYFEYLRGFDTVVTGGAACGMHVRFYAKRFRHVFAFEPDPLSFHCLVNNAPFENVVKLNAAIGHGNGIVGLDRSHMSNIGMHRIADANRFRIPMLAIDSLNLTACDLIQLDVEGYEQFVIQGARRTIDAFKPVIIAERFDGPDHIKFMYGFGYELIDTSFMDSIYTPLGTN